LSLRGGDGVSEPLDKSLVDLARAISAGSVSAPEVLEASLDRLRACHSALNAFTEICEDPGALPHPGPLHGIPIALKDMFVDRGRIPSVGSNVGGRWLRGTATIIRRLREAGGVIAGYANLHEWGVDCTAAVTATGPVRNPRDRERIPGGSSGGSAAALASGALPAAIGTDTGGSIRIPAACCGVVGLKPTWGRVPLDGFVDADSPIDHAGPMGRTVGDVRVLLEVLTAEPVSPLDVSGLRVGVPRTYFFDRLEADVGAAMSSAIKTLSQLVRAVQDVELEALDDSLAGVAAIFAPLTYDMLEHDLRERPDAFQPSTFDLLMTGAEMDVAERNRGESIRQRSVHTWDEAFSEVDVIVTPTLSRTPPTISECIQTDPSGASSATVPYLALNAPMNLAGVPALSLPCGDDGSGWTISMTLSAARGRDDIVLALGEAYERTLDGIYANRISPV
jgi:aspartyl-tRNA(Asn)/glutamyl-tRNA(Gln) amidotransferase subunit A